MVLLCQCTVHLLPVHSQLAGTRTLLHLLLKVRLALGFLAHLRLGQCWRQICRERQLAHAARLEHDHVDPLDRKLKPVLLPKSSDRVTEVNQRTADV